MKMFNDPKVSDFTMFVKIEGMGEEMTTYHMHKAILRDDKWYRYFFSS